MSAKLGQGLCQELTERYIHSVSFGQCSTHAQWHAPCTLACAKVHQTACCETHNSLHVPCKHAHRQKRQLRLCS